MALKLKRVKKGLEENFGKINVTLVIQTKKSTHIPLKIIEKERTVMLRVKRFEWNTKIKIIFLGNIPHMKLFF